MFKFFTGFHRRWEGYCHQCGLCCYEKIRLDDGTWVLDRSQPCPWLDEKTMRCRVYKRRLKVYPRCRRVHLGMALFAPYLPAHCGYVRALRPRWFPKSKLVISESVDGEAVDSDIADGEILDTEANA